LKSFSCDCPRCAGAGQIMCPDCRGEGTKEASIERAVLTKDMTHYSQLLELQQDARLTRRKYAVLCELNPSCSGRYTEQLFATLATIEAQAAKVKGMK
jgi:hypothetical protein